MRRGNTNAGVPPRRRPSSGMFNFEAYTMPSLPRQKAIPQGKIAAIRRSVSFSSSSRA